MALYFISFIFFKALIAYRIIIIKNEKLHCQFLDSTLIKNSLKIKNQSISIQFYTHCSRILDNNPFGKFLCF